MDVSASVALDSDFDTHFSTIHSVKSTFQAIPIPFGVPFENQDLRSAVRAFPGPSPIDLDRLPGNLRQFTDPDLRLLRTVRPAPGAKPFPVVKPSFSVFHRFRISSPCSNATTKQTIRIARAMIVIFINPSFFRAKSRSLSRLSLRRRRQPFRRSTTGLGYTYANRLPVSQLRKNRHRYRSNGLQRTSRPMDNHTSEVPNPRFNRELCPARKEHPMRFRAQKGFKILRTVY